MNSNALATRLGTLTWQSSGQGPALVFFAGALANHDLWRDVVAALQDRYTCITIDLPLGAHHVPLAPGADLSATSLARLQLDCLELLEVSDATLVANDTAGGLLLLSLASNHPALERVGRLVLTNCESFEKFPPPGGLAAIAALSRRAPRLVRSGLRLQARSAGARRSLIATLTAVGLDAAREASFFGPIARDRHVADDFVAAMAGMRPRLLLDAADAIPRFSAPVQLIWGDSCEFFPMADAQRLAAAFPDATLVTVAGAKTWVAIDNINAVAEAIAEFVPTPRSRPIP